MRLHAVANRFNNLLCRDAYSGDNLFFAQLGLYDDNKRDSETAERRVLSVAPDTVLPARRAVSAAGTVFLIGHANPDDFRGETIRVGLVAHEATHLAHVRTLAQVVDSQFGFEAWSGRAWVKNAAFTEQGSHLAPQHHIFFAPGEPVFENHLVTLGTQHYVVRAPVPGASGMLVTSCDELPAPVIETATVGASTWDPVSNTMTGSGATGTVVRVRWQSLFKYRNSMGPDFGPEDIQLAISKTIAAKPGTRVTLSDGAWVLASVADQGTYWLARAVQHA